VGHHLYCSTQCVNESTAVKEKRNNTCAARYGVEHYSQTHISHESLSKLADEEWLIDQHHIKRRSSSDIASDLGVDSTTVLGKMKKMNIAVHRYANSKPEGVLLESIASAYDTRILQNVRSIIPPREIDIYLPEFHLAIEFNGTYWHRPEKFGGYNGWIEYHQSKIDLCAKKGINLIHLWDGVGDHMQIIETAITKPVDNKLASVYNQLYRLKC